MKKRMRHTTRNRQKGMTIFTVAACLLVILAMAALSIDLAALYIARNEAQRAADAAALAGAKKFVSSGYISGLVGQSTAQSDARQEAIVVAAQNLVAGQPANVAQGDVVFDFSTPSNPLITVTVQRTAASGNPVPTLFSKVMGVFNADVSASAMAEAYTPSGGTGPPVGTGCIKPWILPNCDPNHTGASVGNVCTGKAQYVDFDGSITGTMGAIVNPGPAPSGVAGQNLLLKPGRPQDAPVASQFYPIQIPPGTDPALCPPCAGTGGGGAALYRMNIACCNTNQLYCGQTINVDSSSFLQTGDMVGPTFQGTQCLIHQSAPSCGGSASNCGQDYLISPTMFPLQIVGGSNNPNPALQGQFVSSSDSIVTIPLYDGHVLCPGGSCGGTVTIVGFLQVFVEKVGPPQATVVGYLLNVAGCGPGGSGGGSGTGGSTGGSGGGSGGSGSGGSGSITSAGGSLFPVRLVRR